MYKILFLNSCDMICTHDETELFLLPKEQQNIIQSIILSVGLNKKTYKFYSVITTLVWAVLTNSYIIPNPFQTGGNPIDWLCWREQNRALKRGFSCRSAGKKLFKGVSRFFFTCKVVRKQILRASSRPRNAIRLKRKSHSKRCAENWKTKHVFQWIDVKHSWI